MNAPLVGRLTVIGAGLIGSSVARAAREKGLAGEVVVFDADAGVRERVRALGFADAVPQSVAEAVRGADIVIAAVPVGASGAVAEQVGPHLKPGAILSDVGSVKGAVVEAMAPFVPAHAHLVPAHPVAGTEFSGPEAGFASLFENRWCIVTPPEGADPAAVETLAALWRGFGSNVEQMSAQHHDLVLAITSHVPHLIAYNIVGTAEHLEQTLTSEVIKFSAGGFRDFTRIAASDPTMWRDVFLYNREAVLEMLARFNEDLMSLQRAIRYGDGEALFQHFTRTRAIRKSIIEQGQETAAPDFGRRGGEGGAAQ
ncbi:MAG: cyclohexadienyl dehydrogenase [Rhizobiales bacterium 24-66-13]|nr:MAG: cyclohexadienyl dehydrogenase [Azorhizobium sp. 12-66-6]OYY81021.1 MAG: cyclohexadienyl dehydrogenase [Rhizobiales bacterium 35-66-30]OYZ69094.1 MAG: cyclohexadienyl dehydrogenase [Rhizobiales bacterium 24-66-13]OZA96228.1 MAG: cyclohexadienyl dehydrogenase [Rhizobiales bacterium 39-66-18]HQS10474.1 prephenate/arogenate dehydrogenase family protein [Xanthobacteraceae bacterium]